MKILFQGDSITDVGRNTERGSQQSIGQGYALMVTGELGARYPGQYTFENRGISGNRIVDLYARIKVDCWNLEPDVISILLGVNDVWHEFGNGNGVEADRFEKVYRMVIEDTLAKLPNVKFILMEPFALPCTATEGRWEEFYQEIQKLSQIVQNLAKEYHLSYVPLQKKLEEVTTPELSDYWLGDGVHPTPAGHRLIADAWLEVFQKDFA